MWLHNPWWINEWMHNQTCKYINTILNNNAQMLRSSWVNLHFYALYIAEKSKFMAYTLSGEDDRFGQKLAVLLERDKKQDWRLNRWNIDRKVQVKVAVTAAIHLKGLIRMPKGSRDREEDIDCISLIPSVSLLFHYTTVASLINRCVSLKVDKRQLVWSYHCSKIKVITSAAAGVSEAHVATAPISQISNTTKPPPLAPPFAFRSSNSLF